MERLKCDHIKRLSMFFILFFLQVFIYFFTLYVFMFIKYKWIWFPLFRHSECTKFEWNNWSCYSQFKHVSSAQYKTIILWRHKWKTIHLSSFQPLELVCPSGERSRARSATRTTTASPASSAWRRVANEAVKHPFPARRD